VSTDYFRPDAIVIRRSLDLPNGSTVATIDFASAEAFAPVTTTLSVSGLQASDIATLQNTFWSTTSTYASLQSDDASPASVTLYSVPADKLVAGDVHELFVDAYSQSGTVLTGHSFASYFAAPGNRNEAVGPALSSPTLNTVTTAPYARMRGRLTSQPQYNTSVQFGFFQSPNTGADRFTVISATAGYLGGTPTLWDVVIPDFSSTPGFDAAWALIPNEPTGYYAEAFSGRTELLFGARPVDGDLVRYGYRVGTIFTAQLRAAALRAKAGSLLHPSLHQYFRR